MTTPSLMKYKAENDFLEEDFYPKVSNKKETKEILEIMDKYDEGNVESLNKFKENEIKIEYNKHDLIRDKEKSIDNVEYLSVKGDINSPAIRPNTNRIGQESIMLDSETDRNCSFLKHISVNNSHFNDALENKDEVVLCISNLDIETTLSGKKNLFDGNVLQSEEKFIDKKTLHTHKFSMDEITINTARNNENRNLIASEENVSQNKAKYIAIGIVILLIIIGLLIYFI